MQACRLQLPLFEAWLKFWAGAPASASRLGAGWRFDTLIKDCWPLSHTELTRPPIWTRPSGMPSRAITARSGNST